MEVHSKKGFSQTISSTSSSAASGKPKCEKGSVNYVKGQMIKGFESLPPHMKDAI